MFSVGSKESFNFGNNSVLQFEIFGKEPVILD